MWTGLSVKQNYLLSSLHSPKTEASYFCVPSDQGYCNKVHQPKRTAPEADENKILHPPEAVRCRQWPTQPGEGVGGVFDQSELVRLCCY